jgi:hypothetical protein
VTKSNYGTQPLTSLIQGNAIQRRKEISFSKLRNFIWGAVRSKLTNPKVSFLPKQLSSDWISVSEK